MKIIIDIAKDVDGTPLGFQVLDTADPEVITVLQSMQADKTKLQAAGFLDHTSVPGHPVGTTRWDVLVVEANKPTAIPEVQALKLS